MPDTKFSDYRKRVKDLRKCDYGEGEIVGYVNDGEEYWVIRWDNPGLDNEWVEAKEFEFTEMSEDRTIGVSKYVVDDINNIDQVRKYIRLNEKFLTDEQAYAIQTLMGEYIDPPNRVKICYFCHHPKGYHYDESIRDVTQLPCNFTWEDKGLPVPCLCYGWCETKEEADALAKETPTDHPDGCNDCPQCRHPECRHDFGLCNYARDCLCDYYIKEKNKK